MSDVGTTPIELAELLGIDSSELRDWLRSQGWQHEPFARWQLSPEQIAAARIHFTTP